MSELQEFDQAAEDVKNLNSTPSDNDLLELYSLFKQTKVGDCNTDKPGFLDFKGKAKWEAWNKIKGMSSADAQTAYIAKVKSLIAAVGLKS
ncbi:acyl-CoA-binding protein homolog [Drosophila sulfurigaster albostrigata]|uniref:Acyl-CoA-binding protein homolog n=1 Tax=Drosophila albomicans TaxID=7291 RepID=A0A6P8XMR0_DROAB|nr:acyl-CoA-binding protein homolog [Drosophila albomicans]XP_060666634.1 acyl-CoA-binding protein homolog [Drosophila nasuta]XP_062141565.1 acyl-CoA-binding protein homolog [Drosophila sulfurigaster albostrigata]